MATQGRKTGGERSAGKLDAAQLRFVEEFMRDRDGKAAAIRCGYSPHYGARKTAERMLENVAVLREIERRERKRAEHVDIQTDDIIRGIRDIAYFDLRELFEPETGRIRTDPFALDENTIRGLVNFDIVVLNDTGEQIVAINPGNKLKALELLAKFKRLLSDKVEHGGAEVVVMRDPKKNAQ